MGLLSRLKKVTGLESVGEPKPKETDGGRKQKSFWKWAALHFPSRRKGTYDLAKAEEKYGIEAGTLWRDSDAPAPEVLPAEEQQKHNVPDKGTRAYCPPEVKANGRYHAKPTLVWTLGILLFAMVCGHFPTDLDLNMISENNWIRPGLSQECCQMICACLQPDPQQRLALEKMRLHDWFKVTA